MIFTTLNTVAYRIHDPKWAYAPTSGAGAGAHGGRVNRPGINALYLSLELETALAEYKQIDALLPQALMVSYQIVANSVVDFRNGFTGIWDALWQDFYCDWRKLYFNEGIEPPTWVIGDQVLAAGGKGIMFQSVITGGTNLVLYNDALGASDSIIAYDPNQALPKNQTSWT
ncbi:RES family NAD+ phosphorylase [Glaciimonas sp. GG7]